MIIDEFLAIFKINADTEKVKQFSASLAKAATVATAVVGALKTVTLAAWGWADSYVRNAEAMYKSNDSLLKVTKEQVDMSKKYQEGMTKFGKTIESAKTAIAFGFLPTMLEMVNSLNSFLDANKELIVNGIGKLLNIISTASQVVTRLIGTVFNIIDKTIGWKNALYLLGAALLYVKRAMLMAFITNPIVWVIAAIAALLLLVDDFMTYLNGGESQFGEFWGSLVKWIEIVKPYLIEIKEFLTKAFTDSLPYIQAAFEYIVTQVGNLWQIFSGFFEFISALWNGNTEDAIKALDKLAEGVFALLATMISAFASILPKLIDIFKAVLAGAWNIISAWFSMLLNGFRGLVSGIANVASTLVDVITMPFRQAFQWIIDKFSSLPSLIKSAASGIGSMVGIGSGAAANTTNRTTSNSVSISAPISVTSNAPQATANMVGGSLMNLQNTAMQNMQSRVVN